MGISQKNTAPASAETSEANLPAVLTRVGEVTVVDLQVDALQRRLEQSEDQRKEERFLWFMLSGLLLVTLIFSGAGAGAGTFASLIYVGMAFVLSKRWGFDDLQSSLYDAKNLLGLKQTGGDED